MSIKKSILKCIIIIVIVINLLFILTDFVSKALDINIKQIVKIADTENFFRRVNIDQFEHALLGMLLGRKFLDMDEIHD